MGFLSVLGYLVFSAGAVLLWIYRVDVPNWFEDETRAFRRSFIRHAVVGGFPGLREETRLKLAPTGVLRRVERFPRRQINRGAILLLIGPFLFFLDFFV